MNKFLFKSTVADLSKILSILETLQKNTLYITYRVDTLLKKVNSMAIDKGLQTQVDAYFEQDPFGSEFKESLDKTPPQTDTDEQ